MKIEGGVDTPPIDVNLECHPDLVGDVLSIHLVQEPSSVAIWTIFVSVHIAQGTYRLGQLQTNTPATDGASARTVAFAFCPGATGWKVEALCQVDGERAEILLQSSKCCGAQFGVHKNVVMPPVEES